MQSAMYSASAGPCLNPWPGAAAEEPPRRTLRVPSEDEVRVGGQVVLADARADHAARPRATGISGDVLARRVLALAEREAVERVGIDLGAREVGGDLHAEPGDVAVPVEARVVLDPARRVAPRRVAAEEEDVATLDADVDLGREERRQPGAARPDDDVGGRLVVGSDPGGDDARAEPLRFWRRAAGSRWRACRTPASGSQRTPCRSSSPSDGNKRRLPRPACATRAARRPASSCCEAAALRSRRARRANQARPVGSQMRVPVVSCSSSQSERDAPRELRVPLLVAVRGAQKPRVAAGGGAHGARAVLLGEGDVEAAPRELARDRRAGDAGADDECGRRS